MSGDNYKIEIKNIFSDAECNQIDELNKVCCAYDGIYLKLELEFKKQVQNIISEHPENMNEFLCFDGTRLIGCAGILSFDAKEAEITGMVHPDYRRRGVFTQMFDKVKSECAKRQFESILLLADGKSESGIGFIQSAGGKYKTSEYQMELDGIQIAEVTDGISLSPAKPEDLPEIRRQDKMYFGSGDLFENEISENFVTYVIRHENAIIGKIKVDYSEDLPYIGGFGILPEYRGRGYGRQALLQIVNFISLKGYNKCRLEVETSNSNALHLYESCGFKQKSVMNYYSYSI